MREIVLNNNIIILKGREGKGKGGEENRDKWKAESERMNLELCKIIMKRILKIESFFFFVFLQLPVFFHGLNNKKGRFVDTIGSDITHFDIDIFHPINAPSLPLLPPNHF